MPPDNKGGDSSEIKAGCKAGIFRSAGCPGFTVATATARDVLWFGQQNRQEYERSAGEFLWQERLCSDGSFRIASGCRLRATGFFRRACGSVIRSDFGFSASLTSFPSVHYFTAAAQDAEFNRRKRRKRPLA